MTDTVRLRSKGEILGTFFKNDAKLYINMLVEFDTLQCLV